MLADFGRDVLAVASQAVGLAVLGVVRRGGATAHQRPVPRTGPRRGHGESLACQACIVPDEATSLAND